MNLPSFHPKQTTNLTDNLSSKFKAIAAFILIVTGGLLPLLFIPSIHVPLSVGKNMIMILAVAISLLFLVLALLREGAVNLRFPIPIIGAWLIAIATLVSAFITGDVFDSVFGNGLDIYTASFAILMASTMTMMSIFAGHHSSVMRLYVTLIFSALLISIFHLSRFIFGSEAFSVFGFFSGTTASLVGGWNSLAIFYGLIILLALLAIRQLPLSVTGRYLVVSVVVLSLIMLSVVNLSIVWWILAFVSGSVTLFNFVRHLWSKEAVVDRVESNWQSSLVALLILIISVIFLLFGSKLGTIINNSLNISFVEVRPSLTATTELAQITFGENSLFGAGPNRFADVWRTYKDPSVNQTIFWDAQFESGFSFILTHIIGTGILGLLAWLLFLGSLLLYGFKFIFKSSQDDRFWYFIGLSSFVSSLYFWIISLLYVPSSTILLLAAITSGVFVVSYTKLFSGPTFTLSVQNKQIYGFVMVLLAVVLVSASGYGVYTSGKQVVGVYQFSKSVQVGSANGSLEEIETGLVNVFNLTGNDIFARELALLQWSQMLNMLQIEGEANAEQRQQFQTAASRGIEIAQLAVNLDPTDPFNHQALGQIYSVLALVGVEGAKAKATESFATARQFDPQNPNLYLLEADMELNSGENALARQLAEEAVKVRPVHTEALFFLAQLDIDEGNVERAIEIVTDTVQIEPQNPARRYQLGLLLASNNRLDDAISVLESAVTLDPQYANARYFLALGYAEKGMVEEAIEQLTIVRDLNEGNSVVDPLIEQLRENGQLNNTITAEEPVTERDIESSALTEKDLENNNITSSNPVIE